ncbi:hypothetical protein [Agrobacterium sp. LAD9]|uniref:hypothetical protein n=1 Tax=Agrobacterium sp. LAD9 TaxID=2055153 RepID=UPI0012900630|nr:hypothetical protein [Agrobacterium sp. LAD9]
MEIAKINDRIPEELIVRGYRYSRFGTVAFILNEIKSDAVNRILDPVVPTLSLSIPGVQYIDIASARVNEIVVSAKTVVAISARFIDLVAASKQTANGTVTDPPRRRASWGYHIVRQQAGNANVSKLTHLANM